MTKENIEIGLRVRNTRESQKLSREKLAELSNISTQFLADIETGKKSMTISTLKKICNSLCVTSDYIVYGYNNELHINIDSMIATLSIEKQKELENIIQDIIKLVM